MLSLVEWFPFQRYILRSFLRIKLTKKNSWPVTMKFKLTKKNSWPVTMKVICSYETSSTTHTVMWHHIPEDQNPQLHCYEKLRSQRAGIFALQQAVCNCMKQSPAWGADTCAVSCTEAMGSSPLYGGDVLVKDFSFMHVNVFPFNPSSIYTNQPKVLMASKCLWQGYRRQYLCEQNGKTTG